MPNIYLTSLILNIFKAKIISQSIDQLQHCKNYCNKKHYLKTQLVVISVSVSKDLGIVNIIAAEPHHYDAASALKIKNYADPAPASTHNLFLCAI
jgi:hypothetical protein